MESNPWNGFRMQMRGERAMLMLPINVVVTARVRGRIEVDALRSAVGALRARHALLGIRVSFDAENVAWYEADGVPEVPIRVVRGTDSHPWEQVVREECETPFQLETGPLVRMTLLDSPEGAELVITGHHVVCDGMSLTYLVRDILSQLDQPEGEVEVLPAPPAIDETTVPAPKKMNPIARWVMALIGRKWEKQGISCGEQDMERMHAKFRAATGEPVFLRWELSEEETTRLVARCRAEGVTVNSALWAAFLLAQREVQGDREEFRRMGGLAVSTRDELKVPVGDALGFFASSMYLALDLGTSSSFWDASRAVHRAINAELAKTDLFRMLLAEALPPTLLDSLYFAKYDGLENKLAKKMLKRMKWDRTSFGYSVTNVGRVDIPTEYGERRLEAVYGPSLYSDVNEKVVGVTTVGGRLAFTMSCRADGVGGPAAGRIRDEATATLARAIQPIPES